MQNSEKIATINLIMLRVVVTALGLIIVAQKIKQMKEQLSVP
jgi:hypothetical protein